MAGEMLPDIQGLTFGSRITKEYNVRTVQLGDGQSARSIRGINQIDQTVRVRWANITEDEMNLITGFFDDRQGVEHFLVVPRGQTEPLKFTCRGYSATEVTFNHWTVSATFNQVFDVG